MKNSDIIKHVTLEIENIKLYATKEQLKKLNFQRLNPENSALCIYGQMTGYCEGKNGLKLINQCCSKLTELGLDLAPLRKGVRRNNLHVENEAYSFLEAFIIRYPKNNQRIIDYLKGKKEKLEIY
jgi:hypothetical protein